MRSSRRQHRYSHLQTLSGVSWSLFPCHDFLNGYNFILLRSPGDYRDKITQLIVMSHKRAEHKRRWHRKLQHHFCKSHRKFLLQPMGQLKNAQEPQFQRSSENSTGQNILSSVRWWMESLMLLPKRKWAAEQIHYTRLRAQSNREK